MKPFQREVMDGRTDAWRGWDGGAAATAATTTDWVVRKMLACEDNEAWTKARQRQMHNSKKQTRQTWWMQGG